MGEFVITSEEDALAEVAAHVVPADGLHSEEVQHIRRDRRDDGLLETNKNKRGGDLTCLWSSKSLFRN